MFNFTSNTKPRQEQPAGASAPNPAPAPAQQPDDAYIQRRNQEIEAQALDFSKKNPDFAMRQELQNPEFVNYVWGKNLTVEEAYFLVHRQEILEQARAQGAEDALTRRERIPENGAAKNRPAIAKKNPKDLTDKEIDAIIERSRNGEKITF